MNQCPTQRTKTITIVMVLIGLGFAFLLAAHEHSRWQNEYMLRNAMFQVAMDNATACVLCDDKGVITAWSAGAEKMFGLTAKQAVGSDLSQIIPPAMRPKHRREFNNAADRGGVRKGVTVVTCTAERADGTPIDVVITIRSVASNGKHPVFLAAINYADDIKEADLLTGTE